MGGFQVREGLVEFLGNVRGITDDVDVGECAAEGIAFLN
jgi:hypothetical protein